METEKQAWIITTVSSSYHDYLCSNVWIALHVTTNDHKCIVNYHTANNDGSMDSNKHQDTEHYTRIIPISSGIGHNNICSKDNNDCHKRRRLHIADISILEFSVYAFITYSSFFMLLTSIAKEIPSGT